MRSTAFDVLKEAAHQGHKVILTTDHGSILCQHPTTVLARRDATSNLRYKFGQDLRAEISSTAFSTINAKHLRLPEGRVGMTYLVAVEDFFFVYPTKLREYQARYRNRIDVVSARLKEEQVRFEKVDLIVDPENTLGGPGGLNGHAKKLQDEAG